MKPTQPSRVAPDDAFEVLDECHRQTLVVLGELAALIPHLAENGPDKTARTIAADVIRHFSTTARQHHEDEERHVFPRLLAEGDAETVQLVQRLQQDHGWIEADWSELAPLLDAIACGQTWYDLDALREGVEVFTALSMDHVTLEESSIYPQARDRLRNAERLEMGREMAARRKALRERRPLFTGARPRP